MRIHRSVASAALFVLLVLFLPACGGGGGGGVGQPPSPTVTTSVATPAVDNAVVSGDVNPNGLATTAWFEYGQDNTLSTFTKTADQAIGSGTASQSVIATVTGLSAGAIYYYRVVAQNPAGTSKGTINSFSAALLSPTVSTSAANPVSSDNAVLNGEVNPNGFNTEVWFEWGTDPTLNVRTITPRQAKGSGTAPISVSHTLTGLIPGSTYFYRVAAENSMGISHGTIASFKASQIPSVTTNAPAFVTSTTATLNGSVNPNGLQTNYWFVWGTDPNLINPALTTETLPVVIAAGTFTTQPISTPLSGLVIGTTYYFRVVAGNAAGESQGTIRNFQTSVSPTVSTNAATSITTTGAVLNGGVNPNGYATDAWFEYGTDPALSSFTSTTHLPKGSGTTTLSFNATISGLTPWRTYYYRAAASNSGGTEKGIIRNFPTGDYYVAVGDSITAGSQDDNLADGIGFEPILNDLLTAAKGYPQNVANEGISGDTSANGVGYISTALSNHPSAKYFLVMYGTNDAKFVPGPVSSATYKTNMQVIINAIKNAGKTPYLAKVPYSSSPAIDDSSIQAYNITIDQLVAENGILVTPPDFYNYFKDNPGELADGIHPNGTGYQSMANLWFNVLP